MILIMTVFKGHLILRRFLGLSCLKNLGLKKKSEKQLKIFKNNYTKVNPFNSQDQIINSPLKLLHISL